MNKEQKEFVESIAKRKGFSIKFIIDNTIKVNDDLFYTYEDFVSEFFDIEDTRVGMLMIRHGGVPRIKLPYKEGTAWFNLEAMHNKQSIGFHIVTDNSPITTVYGLANGDSGYFSCYGRVKLYDSSWKKVELTIEQIAEKFNLKPEQIRIKK